MSTLVDIEPVKARHIRFEKSLFYVELEDGREIGVPYIWFWRLDKGTDEQRRRWRFIGQGAGIHWEELDEDISVIGLLQGRKDPHPPKFPPAEE
ncbi:MAG: DUF2442 domain-containing protein [Saprospirales bacterium]|nr:DUF2442 domain-containing protein [Saprospirales bacterium]MBK8490612.1 DUF2442 domain-containing protein [Saprospirales bacterium]